MANMSLDIRLRAKLTASAVSVALSTVAITSPALQAGGAYYVTASADCFIRQGASALVLTTIASGNPLWARTYAGPFYCETSADYCFAVIASAAGGSCYLIRAEE